MLINQRKNRIAISPALWYGVLLKGDGHMKKQIIAGISAIACVTLCAAVWPQNAEVGDLQVIDRAILACKNSGLSVLTILLRSTKWLRSVVSYSGISFLLKQRIMPVCVI